MKNLKQIIQEEYQKILREQEERPKVLKIRKVGGNFNCSYNQLKSLEGAPQSVGDSFWCGYNQLQSLEGAPLEVGGNFRCDHNNLQSLEGAPKEVKGQFWCYDNPKQFTEDEVWLASNVSRTIIT